MGIDAILAIIGIVTALASAGFGAYTAMEAGEAQKDLADYNAEVEAENAKAARQKAAYEEGLIREQGAKLRARQRVAFLASGVDLSEGTPLEVLGEQAKTLEMDAAAIRYGGNVEAIKAKQRGDMYRIKGAQDKQAGYYNAGSSLLTGAGRAVNTASTVKW